MKNKLLSVFLLVSMLVCTAIFTVSADAFSFNRNAAAAYADAHWNDNRASYQCCNFVSDCLMAGGLPLGGRKSSTASLYNALIDGGFAKQYKLSSKMYIEGVLEKGDVIYIQCDDYSASGKYLGTHYPHVYICDGVNERGEATASAWSVNRNKVTYWYWAAANDKSYATRHASGTASVRFTCYSLHILTEPVHNCTNCNHIIMKAGECDATVFGTTKTSDAPLLLVNNSAMIPTRFIAENLGATVEWDQAEQKQIITKGDARVVIYVGSTTAYVNRQPVTLHCAPFIKDNRIYGPVRVIAETLGATVEWDSTYQRSIITK
ncbi:MAG: copper amine oxidase N-terminal domain-containing protein [Clostridia bacterium]|nr:copper amine oxidase N-terminal domain-containing protein [Clostridia bacterium]